MGLKILTSPQIRAKILLVRLNQTLAAHFSKSLASLEKILVQILKIILDVYIDPILTELWP